jgi:N6-L-threonylcarbamoyladenine synthase
MKILAIESSCDETAVAVLEGSGDKLKVISNVVASQIAIHKKYGGVVPEVAAREHVLNIIPVVNEALLKAGLNAKTAPKKISAIAVTAGPGLITSLIVGVESAKALAYAWKLPLVAVNHIAGHIYANFISSPISKSQFPISKKIPNTKSQNNQIKFPAIILTVSGGHNLLVLMTGHLKYKIIGDTRDDAAGEAFDKAAKLLGLGYPGGPAVALAASRVRGQAVEAAKVSSSKFQVSSDGVASRRIILPRPMINSKDLDFSFSGLKTALFYQLQKDKHWSKNRSSYAHEFQQAVVDTLVAKTIKAGKKYHAPTIILAGGVSANLVLRQSLKEAIKNQLPHAKFYLPELVYTTDNAAMIGAAGYFKFRAGRTITPAKLKVDPNWDLK